ncbi:MULTISPECIES: hypothetical protein [Pseudoalteromonas]|uniref:Uncharacterized protein n=1 Tax=Pseudoalteromonas amylolytica TaxID=1859457 RepID=A0A1S1MYS7_9GAMM|nr:MULTISPECIES: hypothetical protein [Pseudoalteromonas]OHU87493.1 hypothetical protein BFC16_08515 [Pseudoalteromonas sp. JW3]OHU90936.1 hypothetical protein BET10_08630 [Pseudoalteromonas amylolytica]
MIIRLSQIKSLERYKLRDKQRILAIALDEMPAMRKVALRIAKLTVLIPFFIALAYVEGWSLLPILLLAGLSYPLLTSPIEIQFAKPWLSNAVDKFESQQD